MGLESSVGPASATGGYPFWPEWKAEPRRTNQGKMGGETEATRDKAERGERGRDRRQRGADRAPLAQGSDSVELP